jgi:parallel beta-helix repeat protein
MKQRILSVVCCAISALMVASTALGAGFAHPGLSHTASDLAFIKAKLKAQEQPWQQAWENLLSERSSSLEFQPRPTAHIVRGSYGRGSVGDKDLSGSASAAYSHALQWIVTGDRAHAHKTMEILNAWSPVLRSFEGNDAKLLAGWTGHKFCNAAEIIHYTDAGWSHQDIDRFKHMLLTVYIPLIYDFFPEANGNWDAAMMNTMLSIGVFCDDQALFDRALSRFLRGTGNGGITRYIYPSGQCDESARDQAHTQLGLGELAQACQVAWHQGVDLYGAAGNRLALGFEYTARYNLGEEVPAYGTISSKARGRFRGIYAGVYQHYRKVKGLEMPYTYRALEKTRARSWDALAAPHSAMDGGLTLKRAPSPSPIAKRAGAQSKSMFQAPTEALLVEAGQSIQAALDAQAGSKGWVVLGKGLHTLNAALRMPSGVTLAGQGLDSVLFLDPDREGPAIVNGDPNLHDVTFRDFVVEGALTERPSRDANQDRRQRSYQMAPSRAGILLAAASGAHMERLHFEHVTVRHCTHNGVALRGAAQVLVRACDFSDNGSSVVPGPGQQHNLLLAHVEEVQIRGCRLDDSPWGSGLNLIHGRDIEVLDSEAARNTRHGIRCTESQDIQINGNLAEGNDGWGIRCDALMHGCRGVEIVDNLVQNNDRGGIEVYRTGETRLHNNRLMDNGVKHKGE